MATTDPFKQRRRHTKNAYKSPTTPFKTRRIYKEADAYLLKRRLKRPRTAAVNREYLFGGREIGVVKGHVRMISKVTGRPKKRYLFGGEERYSANEARYTYARERSIISRLPGEFRGTVKPPRVYRSRKQENAGTY